MKRDSDGGASKPTNATDSIAALIQPYTPQFSPSVDYDLLCRGCDYNLRTLGWASVCPECGLDIGRSPLPETFRFRTWREFHRVRIGMVCIVAAIFVSAVLTLGYAVLSLFWTQLYRSTWSGWLRPCTWAWGYGLVAARASIMAAILWAVSGSYWGLHRHSPFLGRTIGAIAVISMIFEVLALFNFQIVPMWLFEPGSAAQSITASVIAFASSSAAPMAMTLFWAWLARGTNASLAPWIKYVLVIAAAALVVRGATEVAFEGQIAYSMAKYGRWTSGMGEWEDWLNTAFMWSIEWQHVFGNAGLAVAAASAAVFLRGIRREADDSARSRVAVRRSRAGVATATKHRP